MTDLEWIDMGAGAYARGREWVYVVSVDEISGVTLTRYRPAQTWPSRDRRGAIEFTLAAQAARNALFIGKPPPRALGGVAEALAALTGLARHWAQVYEDGGSLMTWPAWQHPGSATRPRDPRLRAQLPDRDLLPPGEPQPGVRVVVDRGDPGPAPGLRLGEGEVVRLIAPIEFLPFAHQVAGVPGPGKVLRTGAGRVVTEEEIAHWVEEAERGYDLDALPSIPGHAGPGHTPDGPDGCARCQLLRDNAHWMGHMLEAHDHPHGDAISDPEGDEPHIHPHSHGGEGHAHEHAHRHAARPAAGFGSGDAIGTLMDALRASPQTRRRMARTLGGESPPDVRGPVTACPQCGNLVRDLAGRAGHKMDCTEPSRHREGE